MRRFVANLGRSIWLLLGFAAAPFALATGTGTPQAAASAEPAALRPAVLRVGLQRVVFANLNENDATAAYRAFIIAIGRKRGYDVRPEVVVYNTLPHLESSLRSGVVNLAIMSSWQLLETGLRDAIDVEFATVSGGITKRRSLVLAKRNGPVQNVADLKGRSLLVLRDTRATLGQHWLDVLCLSAGFGSAEQHLGRIAVVVRANAAILPVFFGRSDACVVDEQTFAVTCELNPQLGRELVVVAQSEPMLDTVVCLNRTGWESDEIRQAVRQGLAELHDEPSGRQLLTLFRIDRLVPFEPALLDSVTALYKRRGATEAAGSAAGDGPLSAGAMR